jgi:hypothetical protein
MQVPHAPVPLMQLSSNSCRDTAASILSRIPTGARSPKNPALSPLAGCLPLCRLRLCPLPCPVPRPAQTARTPRVRRVGVRGMLDMKGMFLVSLVL